MEIGLLVLRVVLGLTLAAHGVQKLFGWFGGPGIAGLGSWLETIGFVPGRRQAVMAGLSEAGGGLLLALGLLTPLAAAVALAVMAVAGISVHWKAGFFATQGGYEYTLVIGLAALSLAFTGPGALSLDSLLGLELAGARWGLAALAAGAIGGALPLLMRRQPVSA
jgi:putative oxidoreductase